MDGRNPSDGILQETADAGSTVGDLCEGHIRDLSATLLLATQEIALSLLSEKIQQDCRPPKANPSRFPAPTRLDFTPTRRTMPPALKDTLCHIRWCPVEQEATYSEQ